MVDTKSQYTETPQRKMTNKFSRNILRQIVGEEGAKRAFNSFTFDDLHNTGKKNNSLSMESKFTTRLTRF